MFDDLLKSSLLVFMTCIAYGNLSTALYVWMLKCQTYHVFLAHILVVNYSIEVMFQ